MGITGRTTVDCSSRIRADRFTTVTQQRRDQFAYWKEWVAPLVDIERDESTEGGYFASARGHDLGSLHFASSSMDPMQYRHTEDHVRASGIDHWCLAILKRGNEISRAGDRVLTSSAGSLQVRSFAYPFVGRSDGTSSACLFLSRDNFPDISDMLDAVHHIGVTGSLVEVLKEYIITLEDYIKTLRVSEISLVVESLTLLLSAALKPAANNIGVAEMPIAAGRFNLARKYIQRYLASPDLGANSICRTLGISRRQLYYLFERHGGVEKFIRQRRLAACCKAIADPMDHRLINTIACSYGFTNQALFSRQFRAAYGFSPTEARAAGLSGHRPEPSPPKTFSEWLLRTRGS
ncbi:helix-turn-helix domain-containing protein [Microbulbifer rhizosphaerae]|uniref:AraC-like DNA-binding protein n=1 Tax=Microbulbifer rhizosphaerae TaxID=1562603 RepID=A0A7W4WAF1_9GAMM|nr:helix-turn-helix domain-containing protein [Microbulbifer rhizosphaerae]MBB3060646.1 AraC-like DNA-binding protein [Microbulbifer rhizosphaerae]